MIIALKSGNDFMELAQINLFEIIRFDYFLNVSKYVLITISKKELFLHYWIALPSERANPLKSGGAKPRV